MKFVSIFAVLAASIASTYGADPLVVNPPTHAVVNTPTVITWSGGVVTFQTITDSATNNMPITLNFPNIAGTSFTWNTVVPADTVAVAAVTDSRGETAFSGPFIVQPNFVTADVREQKRV
ncbi:hypothetical protein BV20DRAFT_1056468 [Pilatotrama ljubarskyi]|nr:hypothetical protein BV20DRAFT_1056468 [Pilatotrama ljubarskyi]